MAEVREVRIPDIGDFADVPIIEVLVSPGDEVSPEDPLVVLESEKATTEIPAPFGGTVAELSVKVGDEVSEGDLILTLSEDGAGGAGDDGGEDGEREAEPAAEEEPADDEPADEEPPVEEDDDGGEPDAGDGGAGSVQKEPVDQEPEADEEPAEAPAPSSSGEAADGDGEDGDGGGDGDPYAGPGARRLARELGVELGEVRGSGPKGRITKEDVTAAAEGGPSERGRSEGDPSEDGAGAPAVAGLPPWPKVDFARFGPVETVPLSRIKRVAGPNLARNWVAIPHVTQHDEADVTELEDFRTETNAAHADEGVKVTMTALLLKATAVALRSFPEFNASLEGQDLVLKRYYHLGFAADTPQGLVVPVIRDVDRKGLLEIARELADLSRLAREGRLGSADMQGGTFTISSLGGIGGTAFTPIINAPEVAILGVSRADMRPVWIDGAFQPRLVLPLSLSYDHRVIDGAAAARFTTHLVRLLGDPRQMLL